MKAPKELSARLRDAADNIHSRGPGMAAELLREAADALDSVPLQNTATIHVLRASQPDDAAIDEPA